MKRRSAGEVSNIAAYNGKLMYSQLARAPAKLFRRSPLRFGFFEIRQSSNEGISLPREAGLIKGHSNLVILEPARYAVVSVHKN